MTKYDNRITTIKLKKSKLQEMDINFSDNLLILKVETCLEWQCQDHKNIAGQSIWEIGRRLNHVKENDLAHGQFEKWVENLGMATSEARKFMTVAKRLPNLNVERFRNICFIPHRNSTRRRKANPA
ncbi:hypothetical protein MX009_06135 [Streptococcus uberis]|uniref:hypothetical protein n=1 Tax=Streptococcus uberis TaxID=1349 RepID=UPI001FF1BBA2|nr:hypothetical protein [Streptococcus uberis]MCK1229960.1 hypothetical protein [Streptococcus uberis]